jgi:hypothetical protein
LTPKQAMRLDGRDYLRLAWRVAAYQGVMAARVAEENDDETSGPRGDVKQVEPTREALANDPAFAGLIEGW